MKSASVHPWATGPGEILRHGLELLRKDSDTQARQESRAIARAQGGQSIDTAGRARGRDALRRGPSRPGRNRTCNPRFWRPVLYQLSYGPKDWTPRRRAAERPRQSTANLT